MLESKEGATSCEEYPKTRVGTLGNDNGDTLYAHHAFCTISLSLQHDCVVKMPNFTFCGRREHKKGTFFFFS